MLRGYAWGCHEYWLYKPNTVYLYTHTHTHTQIVLVHKYSEIIWLMIFGQGLMQIRFCINLVKIVWILSILVKKPFHIWSV